MRSLLRRTTVAVATGALTVSAAWAGASLAPLSTDDPADAVEDAVSSVSDVAAGATGSEGQDQSIAQAPAADQPLEDGWYLAGAAKVSLYPQPDEEAGEIWERDPAKCKTLSENFFTELPDSASHVASATSPWPENPNCIYMGGYGIGPMNPIVDWDAAPEDSALTGEEESGYGLWARTFALSDGQDELFLTVIDAEGWFWDYNSKCDDCGFKQIGERLAGELDADPSSFIFHSTHSHTSMDFIGGWGFVPDWYMEQATEAIEQSVLEASASMQPARLEIGEVEARQFNHERRDTYRAAEEQQLTWLRAFVPGPGSSGLGETIATMGTYAAHPTTMDEGAGVAHGDWPVVFETRLEDRFGGVGFHFMTGLGNMSVGFPGHERHEGENSVDMGRALADLVPEVGEGEPIAATEIATAQSVWNQPATNVPLTALGAPGFFDRKFQQVPAAVSVGPRLLPEAPDEDGGTLSDPVNDVTGAVGNCNSASPVSVEVAANAASIGDQLYITSGPGELFSNLTNVIKEKAKENLGGAYAMPLAQANDALGYIIQSFEMANPASQQGAGFGTSGPLYIEYEDAYSIDRCFGDMVLETTLGLLPVVRDAN